MIKIEKQDDQKIMKKGNFQGDIIYTKNYPLIVNIKDNKNNKYNRAKFLKF